MGNIAVCRYVVKQGKEAEFEELLGKHHPTLSRLGLLVPQPHMVLRGHKEDGTTFYVEILAWKDEAAVNRAHEHPEVASIWEPMGPLCDLMEFPHAEELHL